MSVLHRVRTVLRVAIPYGTLFLPLVTWFTRDWETFPLNSTDVRHLIYGAKQVHWRVSRVCETRASYLSRKIYHDSFSYDVFYSERRISIRLGLVYARSYGSPNIW